MYESTPVEIVGELDTIRPGISDHEFACATFLGSYRNAATRKNYQAALRAWFQWCEQRGVTDPLRDVVRAHVEFWLRQMEEIEGVSVRTIAGRITALNMFYRYAVIDGLIERNPCDYVKRPRVERVSTTAYLTRVEMGKVFDAAAAVRPRDEAILRLLGANGLRVAELVRIDIEDLGRERGYQTVIVHRKGGKTQKLPLAPPTGYAIDRTVGDRTSGPLFTSLRTEGKRLNRNDIGRLCKHYAKVCGIRKRIHPHSFRHSFVTLSLDAGASERDVANSAGHADLRMVSYYDRNRDSLVNNTTRRVSDWVEGAI